MDRRNRRLFVLACREMDARAKEVDRPKVEAINFHNCPRWGIGLPPPADMDTSNQSLTLPDDDSEKLAIPTLHSLDKESPPPQDVRTSCRSVGTDIADFLPPSGGCPNEVGLPPSEAAGRSAAGFKEEDKKLVGLHTLDDEFGIGDEEFPEGNVVAF